nr:hypothetical protein [uncultured Allomuricauda sp.]
MKKVFLVLLMAIGLTAVAASCEAESIDEEIKLFGPDKTTPPPGSGDD